MATNRMFKNVFHVFTVIAILLFVSCTQKKNHFIINGEIKGAENQSIQLQKLSYTDMLIIDSAKADDKGVFQLKGEFVEEGAYAIQIADESIIFIIDNSTISIKGSLNQIHDLEFKGSEGSKNLAEYNKKIDSLGQQIMAANQAREELMLSDDADNADYETIDNHISELYDSLRDYAKTVAKESKTQSVSIIAASNFFNDPNEMEFLKEFNNSIDTRFSRNEFGKEFSKLLSEKEIEYLQKHQNDIKVGQKAPDFTLPQEDGNPISLSDYKGQYVLIDFWASWCTPCRKENPNVVKSYNEFKDKNFTVFGVSIDEDKNAWIEAVKNDQLVWKQVIDTDGWKSKVAELYNVQAIPANFLVDPEGTVIATNLRGAQLKRELEKVLN